MLERDSRYQVLRVLGLMPLVALVPLLDEPVPSKFQSVREIANYYQSLAVVRSGLSSYTYVTLQETDAAVHLYSVLSSPLVALGYVEAGRLVSALAALRHSLWSRR